MTSHIDRPRNLAAPTSDLFDTLDGMMGSDLATGSPAAEEKPKLRSSFGRCDCRHRALRDEGPRLA